MLLPMAAALPLVSLTTTLVTTLITAPAAAQGVEDARQFEIAAGSLSDVLARFAAETGVSLSFDSSLAAGKTSPGVNGRYDFDRALRQLLSGTDLEAVRAIEGGYRLALKPPVASGVTLMQAVQVQAITIDPTVTENSHSYTTPAVSVGGKTAREPRQLQQQVTVITAQRIKDQVLTTVEEAIGQAIGVTMAQGTGYSSNASFYSRGFAMGVQMDGGAVNVNNSWYNTGLPDMAIIDHIEVLRGSDGLFSGSGSPGGTVNVVRKRPLDHQQVSFDAIAASWDRYRTQIDVSSPLAFDGKLRGRFAAAEEKRHYFYDTVSTEKSVLYGVLEADLTDSTLFTVGTSFEQFDRNGLFFGLPRYSTGADLKLARSTCLCTDWSGREDEMREMFARVEQQLGERWKLKLNVGQQWVDYWYKQGNVTGGTGISPATGAGASLQASRTDVSNITKLADITLDGVFEVFGLQQEFVLGWNWQDMFSDGTGVSLYPTQPPVDVFNFGSRDIAEPGTPATYVPLLAYGGQRQSGTYATLRSEWFEGLHSVIGLRNSTFKNLFTARDFYSKDKNVRTPYAGLSYDITKAMTTYFSYAQIYQMQAYSIGTDGKPIDPIEGDTYELGLKGSWFGGNLNAQAAVYKVERRNAAISVGTSTEYQYCCYIGGAKIESRGFDAEVVGQLLPGWDLQLGYTFNINEYKSGYANNGASYSPRTPKHLVKFWSMVKLPGDWSDVRLGGGVNWQSINYVTGSAATYNPASDKYDGPTVQFDYSQKAYAVVALRGEYKLDPNWLVALNVNNLLDETYYQTVSTSSTGNYYGEPRSWILSLSGRW